MISAFSFFISDAAKLESTLEDMTVHAALGTAANLTVKFCINPISNYNISWSMGDIQFKDDDITNAEEGEHVQTTYSILNVTKSLYGNYTVQVINEVIPSESNEALFFMVLALTGKDNYKQFMLPLSFRRYNTGKPSLNTIIGYDITRKASLIFADLFLESLGHLSLLIFCTAADHIKIESCIQFFLE